MVNLQLCYLVRAAGGSKPLRTALFKIGQFRSPYVEFIVKSRLSLLSVCARRSKRSHARKL